MQLEKLKKVKLLIISKKKKIIMKLYFQFSAVH